MRVLIVGSGAREHALAWKLARAEGVEELYAAPGNPGIAALAHCVPIGADATVELAEFAASLRMDFTVVGPELPLCLGIADEFARRGLPLLGPSRAAAEIEGSKVLAKELCLRYGIPTARAVVARNRDEMAAAARKFGLPVVLKADGLAAGKGVLVCRTPQQLDEALVRFGEEHAFGAAGERVLVEECLEGQEVSFMVLTDGSTVLPLASARDYKRLEDGDRGPNTGGMGAVSPAPLPQGLAAAILKDIVYPAVNGLAQEGRPFRGVLYAGVMATAEGPKLLEFNCRLGDPETQVVIPRLDGDLLPLLQAAARGELGTLRAGWRHEALACVVLAAAGYPDAPRRGNLVSGLGDALNLDGTLVFQAGTGLEEGRLVTSGGRVLSVIGRGPSIAEAVATAYQAVSLIHFEGMQYRTDIGKDLS
ncbi:MAG TPA: phosphoribosylamine--glycine ligase [Thermoanaerobaculaceae bacterium]|nr:phosphoribosylamine--glycine ligase [Thermoanaerobaculaceae bacterium]HRS17302.1 phosphoribosylamine--glycine ligase [Thermoanaerobaculaceae bacterium]